MFIAVIYEMEGALIPKIHLITIRSGSASLRGESKRVLSEPWQFDDIIKRIIRPGK